MSKVEEKKFSRKHIIVLVFLIVLVCGMLICLGIGRYSVPIVQTVKILVNRIPFVNLTQTWTDQMESVVISVRLPRVIGAAMVGCALSLSGATYQGVFKNPLVSPDLLGVSNGACVGAALAILLHLTSYEIQIFALAFGLITVLITSLIPRLFKNDSNLMLVLSGVIVSGFMSSMLGIMKYIADPEDELASITYWTLGSLSGVRFTDVLTVMPAIIAAMIVLLALRWRVNLLSLGESEAKSLGVNIRVVRGLTVVCSTVLTACAICICGTIGWVGLIIPHFARLLIGHDNRFLMPMSTILGGIFLLIVDTLARNVTTSEIPLSIITGIIGTPLFIWLLAIQKTRIN